MCCCFGNIAYLFPFFLHFMLLARTQSYFSGSQFVRRRSFLISPMKRNAPNFPTSSHQNKASRTQPYAFSLGVRVVNASTSAHSREEEPCKIDLTEEQMRKMSSEELKAELGRRGIDYDGLKNISMEHSSKKPDSSAVVTSTTAVASATTVKHHNNTIKISPDKTYIMRFDGGSRGNPGVAGAGMVLYDAQTMVELWSGSLYISSESTNNEAEYQGLVNGLKCAKKFGAKRIMAQGDSNLVVQQILGNFKCKSPKLIPMYHEARMLKDEFESFQIRHIPREQNHRADELANEAMDTRRSRGVEVLGFA